jgi:hypothetical protein
MDCRRGLEQLCAHQSFLGSDIDTRDLASFDIPAFQELTPISKTLRPTPQSGVRLPPSSYSSRTLLQPSMMRSNAGLDAEACRLWKACRRQEVGIGTGRQRSANKLGCAARYWIRPPRANTSVAVETVGLMSHVRLAVGFQEKDSVSKGGREEILITNNSAGLHAFLPARLLA